MGTISLVESITLDGVMQGLGAPDEDTRDGFAHGGWGPAYADHVAAEEMGKGMSEGSEAGAAMLFGRVTYAQFATFWPFQPDENPAAGYMNHATKYVVTETLEAPLPWDNSIAVRYEDVATLEPDLTVLGSGELARALLADDLVDHLTLLIHPLLLGTGRRLFGAGELSRFELVSSVPTTTGVIVATYRPAA